MKQTKFSILVLVNTIEYIESIMKSIKNASNFSSVEIILLSDVEEKDQKEKLDELTKTYSNIICVDVSGKEKAEAYNLGMEYATGNYISFIEQDVTYSKDAIKKVNQCIKNEKARVVALKPYFLQENRAKAYKMSPKKCTEVDLNFMPMKLNLALDSYFIHKKLVGKFDETLIFEDAKMKFLLEILMKYPFYYFMRNVPIHYTVAKEDDTSTNFMQYDKKWYSESLTSFVIPFLEKIYSVNKQIPLYIQEAMLYYIFAKYNCNTKDRNKMVLSKEEAKQFFDYTAIAMQYIDTGLILNLNKNALFKIPRWLGYQLVLEKNKKLGLKTDLEVRSNELQENEVPKNKLYLYNLEDAEDSYIVNSIEKEHIIISSINVNKETMEFNFTLSLQDLLEEKDVKVFVKYGDKKIEAQKTNCYPLLKVFGLTVSKQIPFTVVLNLEDKNEKIQFLVKYKNKEYQVKIKFDKAQAHLNHSKYSYWKFNDKYYLCNKQNFLIIEKKKLFSGLIKESKYFVARMLRAKNKIFTAKYFALRFAYWCTKPFYKNKQIWITFDKLYKAGDNGEYMYHYIKQHHPEIKMYYVIKKDSLDYERLKHEKNSSILVYGTFKHKLISLLSNVILDTHANAVSYCSFDTKKARMLIKDLFNAEVVCIQHGLSIQKIAQYQNRLFDNIKLYCCASPYEVKNLLGSTMYDYKEEQIKLTGLARYDGLKSKEQRNILITPTWRRNIVNSNVAHVKKSHNNFFKNSKYYEIYNTLINDKKLIETAKKNNYKITYLLHPAISAQKEDFEKNEYVEIIAATDNMNYEKVLTEASLMVTDYSGVQFDFAYMRKPIVYYHPDELPPHYEAGGLEYATMGFGPICKSNNEIVDTLCKYMENNCKTEEEYVKRANDFFAFDDYKNCERIYESIMEYIKERN